jgi:sugar lactone lactonase YvrE
MVKYSFGGVDLKTLYITGATQKRNVDELIRLPLSGYVISTDVHVKGIQENSYID